MLMLEPPFSCREPPASCRYRLHQISVALQSYHNSYGLFPPAYISDKAGKPMHSWRVLILPFLGQQELYDKYRFDEPWDGPHISQLHAEQSHWIFRCSSGGLYVAVVGPHTVWPGAKATRLSDITDEPAKTIMVVESSNSERHWMEPYDLQVETMSLNISEGSHHGSPHHTHRMWIWQSVYNYAHARMADGSLRRLKADTEPKTINALLTIDGQD